MSASRWTFARIEAAATTAQRASPVISGSCGPANERIRTASVIRYSRRAAQRRDRALHRENARPVNVEPVDLGDAGAADAPTRSRAL